MLVVPSPVGYSGKQWDTVGSWAAGWVMVASVGWVTVAKSEQKMVASSEWGMALHVRVSG